jgi:hypothetical protein
MATVVRLPDPPREYDRAYMEKLIGQINAQFRALAAVDAVRGTTANFATLPASAAGLRSGDVWADPLSGELYIVA